MIDTDFSLLDVSIEGVTSAQVGACTKIYDEQLRREVWMVQSESDPLKEYKTFWNPIAGPSCTCPAGLHSFLDCRDGHCKHIRWIAAAEREEHHAIDEQHLLMIDGRRASVQEEKRILCLHPAPVQKSRATAPIHHNRGFSLLKEAQ